MSDKKIALFIDCENISSNYIDDIFNELANHGEVIIRQAYKNFSKSNKNWEDVLVKYAIKPMQTIIANSSKNISDFQIVIDVMNTIYNSKIDTIVIASSDSDFTPLAMEVKSKGIEVIGFGEEKTPNSLKNAYSTFIRLPIGDLEDKIKDNLNNAKKKQMIDILKDAIKNSCDENGFALASKVGTYLKNKNSSYHAKNFGKNSWGEIFKKYSEYFETDYKDDRKSILIVKIKDI